jgi:hypothetical protein
VFDDVPPPACRGGIRRSFLELMQAQCGFPQRVGPVGDSRPGQISAGEVNA